MKCGLCHVAYSVVVRLCIWVGLLGSLLRPIIGTWGVSVVKNTRCGHVRMCCLCLRSLCLRSCFSTRPVSLPFYLQSAFSCAMCAAALRLRLRGSSPTCPCLSEPPV